MHLRPSDETFAVACDSYGLERLAERLVRRLGVSVVRQQRKPAPRTKRSSSIFGPTLPCPAEPLVIAGDKIRHGWTANGGRQVRPTHFSAVHAKAMVGGTLRVTETPIRSRLVRASGREAVGRTRRRSSRG